MGSPEEEASLREKFPQLPRSYVLSVGSIEPRKNVPRLLQAWKRCLAELPNDLHLVLVGKRGRYEVFGDSVALPEVDRVVELGYAPDDLLPSLYSAAKGFVYVSEYEGFGLPVAEALACGTPVLTSNCSSLPEVAGAHGILVDPVSVDSIAAGMLGLVKQFSIRDREKRGLVDHARLFSWDVAASKTWEILASRSRLA
jgi:glycosyltransferase involved in cell wall biosynthesis